MSAVQIISQEERVITLKEITDLIGMEHNKAMRVVDKLSKEPSFGGVEKLATPTYNPNGSFNREIQTYSFTKKQAIAVGAKLNNAMLMKVIDRLEELEKERNQNTISLPNFSDAVAAARAWADEREKKELALKELDEVQQERDKAIVEKLWISSKREATAMSTASKATKQVKKLETLLDMSKEYSTTRKQEKRFNCKFAWSPLKKYCKDHNLPIKKVDDDLYENVNSYPAEAWLEVYSVDITSTTNRVKESA